MLAIAVELSPTQFAVIPDGIWNFIGSDLFKAILGFLTVPAIGLMGLSVIRDWFDNVRVRACLSWLWLTCCAVLLLIQVAAVIIATSLPPGIQKVLVIIVLVAIAATILGSIVSAIVVNRRYRQDVRRLT